MSFKKFREISHKTGLMSAFVAFVAISVGAMSATPVHAVQYRFGDVDVQIDNIVSFGMSLRTASRELALLPARNGGSRKDGTIGLDLVRYLGTTPGGMLAGVSAKTGDTIKARLAARDAGTARDMAQTAYDTAKAAADADPTDTTLATAATTAMSALTTAMNTFTTAEEAVATAVTAQETAETAYGAAVAEEHRLAAAGTPSAAWVAALGCGDASNLSGHAQRADSAVVGAAGSHCVYGNTGVSLAGLTEDYNYDASINTDDGRLNFDKDDLIGGTFKVTTELEAQTGDFTFFARINAFYDAVLADDSNFARSEPLKNANRAQVYDIDMLDFYVDWSSEVANLPFTLRAGRQVINWGEATFILGGNSVFNPISVPAFRRPGSEIKEALLPVMAIYGSLSLPYDLTVEAYAGGWDSYDIDPGGGPFANSDSFEPGSGKGGNGPRTYVGSGAYSGDNRRNCDAAATGNEIVTQAYGAVFNEVFGDCKNTNLHYLHNAASGGPNALGFVEQSRQEYFNVVKAGRDEAGVKLGDTGFLVRADDNDPSDDGNYGISLRWYAENLNSTEFAVYYQNYTSRIPYAATIAYTPVAGPNVTNPNSSSTSRGATATGCAISFAASTGRYLGAVAATPSGDTPPTFASIAGFVRPRVTDANDKPVDTALDEVRVDDPTGVVAQARKDIFETSAVLDPITTLAATNLATKLTGLKADGTLAGLGVSDATADLIIAQATKANLDAIVAEAAKDALDNTVAQGISLGCAATMAQATGGSFLPTGASNIVTRYQIGLTAQYPEDIEVYGLSFNTTLLGWGVQGEIAYRDAMPLQLDTDALSIQAIAASCAWENFSAVATTYYGLQTLDSTCSNHGVNGTVYDGFVREKVYNIDIGTTATFTRSNPAVSALGADLGVFLTELGYVNVPNAEDYRTGARLANQCTSGSDLPLGAVFALDPRTSDACRPTEESSGIVLFGYLQYNNVFGSAIGLRPTFAYQRGIDGRSPSPAGSFIEDNESLSLSVTAEYQAKWTASLGYTMYDGDVLYNRNVDRDYLSASVSYAF